MNYRPMLWTNTGLLLGMAAFSAWAWDKIPADALVPVHWNFEGEPDRFGGKLEVLGMMPGILIVVTVILYLIPRIDPRRANLEASAKFWNSAAIGVAGLLAYLHALIGLAAMGMKFDMFAAMIPGLSLLFVVMGNYLGKTRSNWFGGVRTPWTLSSEYSWEKTHRLAGRLFVSSGIIGIMAWAAIGGRVAFFALSGAILISVFVSVVMSYHYWKNDPARDVSKASSA